MLNSKDLSYGGAGRPVARFVCTVFRFGYSAEKLIIPEGAKLDTTRINTINV